VFSHAPGDNLGPPHAEGLLSRRHHLAPDGQVLDALACAHASGVIHRDIKPDNLVISSTGARPNAMVLDFGLGVLTATSGRWGSRLTLRGEYVGTPAYSPPEQLLGTDPTPAADLYAWGITTIEALTGCRVMVGATLQETLHRQLSTDPVFIPPRLRDTDLGELLARVCEKDVSRRLGDAVTALEQFRRIDPRDIEPIIAGENDKTPPRRSTPSRSTRKHPVFSVPLSRNPRFTGRETVLADIAGNLRTSGLLAVCALKGMGGVGKTQLALEYAFRHADEYQVVAWLRAEDAGTLDADFARLAAALGLPEADAPEEHRRIDAAKAWLANHDRWLLIFDNAPDPRLIRSYLPRNESGHVLITSRNQSWQGLARSVAVDVLRSDDATQFLLSRSGREETESARRVAQLLGNLPLALEEAAAYVEASGRTLADYARLFAEHQNRAAHASPSSRRLSRHAAHRGT
jgi:hypothetical protein